MEQPVENGHHEEAAVAPKQGRRCFVGNLAWRTSWQDLKVSLLPMQCTQAAVGRQHAGQGAAERRAFYPRR